MADTAQRYGAMVWRDDMAQSKQQIQATLAAAGVTPRHRFGQNFMIDQNLVRLIADEAAVAAGDAIIEVGPGTGTLTDEMLGRGAQVTAVEIDRDLAAALRVTFANNAAFTLIEGDALDGKHSLNPQLAAAISASAGRAKLVANLPYNIASPLVVDLLLSGVDLLVFTVQKEVADRLRGSPDGDDYGPLTVIVQLLARVEVLRTLPPQAFWPAPKIHSSLVRLTRDDRLGPSARPFSEFVHKLFSFRRKTLRKAVEMSGETAALPDEYNPALRAEAFTPTQLLTLFRALRA